MTKKKLTVMGVALAASAAIVLPMTSANAYPPGQHLTVTAAAPLDDPTHYTVVVTNGKPGCQLKLSVHGRDAYGKIGSDGTATVPLLVGPISGVYVIHARTYGCKATENATFKVVVTKYKLLGPKQVRAGEKFAVQATGWLPGLPTTFTISDGKKTLTFLTETDPNGRVTQGVSVPYPGTWAVVVTQQGGPTKSYALQVLPTTKHHHTTPAKGKPAPKPQPKQVPKHVHKHQPGHH